MKLVILSSALIMALSVPSALAKPKGTSSGELPACPAGFNQKSLDEKCRVCTKVYNNASHQVVVETKSFCWADSKSRPGGVQAAPPKDKSQ